MKGSSILVSLVLILIFSNCRMYTRYRNLAKEEYISDKIEWQNQKRTFHIHIPNHLTGNPTKKSLVVMLHGRLGTGLQVMEQTGLNALSDQESFFIVYPDGYSRSWADGRGNTPADKEGIDDVGYLKSLISSLIEKYPIDKNMVFIAGHSNGGFITQRMLLESTTTFAAGVSVSSQLSVALLKKYEPSSPVSVAMIVGTADPLVPYFGGYVRDGGEILGADESIYRWSQWNFCSGEKTEISKNTASDKTTLVIINFNGCKKDVKVRLYRINEGGHAWPGQDQRIPFVNMGNPTFEIDAAKEMITFFKENGL